MEQMEYKKAAPEKADWQKPELNHLSAGLSDVKDGFAPGSDGDVPGPPDTSLS